MVERYISFVGEPGLAPTLVIMRLIDGRHYDPETGAWRKPRGRKRSLAMTCIAPGRYAAALPFLERKTTYYFQVSVDERMLDALVLADLDEKFKASRFVIAEGRPPDPQHVVVADLRPGRGIELGE